MYRLSLIHISKPEIHVEICSKCHPFYTGQQKANQARGRIEQFNKKYKECKQNIEDSLAILDEESDEEMRELAKEELKDCLLYTSRCV